jgi:hypothetical protein
MDVNAPPARRDEHDGTMATMGENQETHRVHRGIVPIVIWPSARSDVRRH